MVLERLRPTAYRLTLHAVELATLVSALRWASEGGGGELTTEAREQLGQVLASFQAEQQRLGS